MAGGLPCCVLGRRRTAAGAVAAGLLLAPGDKARRCGGGGAGQAGLHSSLPAHFAQLCCCWFTCRLEELDDIGREWRSLATAAHELDRRLQATPFHTLCHGDFKTEVCCWGGVPGSVQGLVELGPQQLVWLHGQQHYYCMRVCVSAKRSHPFPSLQNMLFSDPSRGKSGGELEVAACECSCAGWAGRCLCNPCCPAAALPLLRVPSLKPNPSNAFCTSRVFPPVPIRADDFQYVGSGRRRGAAAVLAALA